MSFIKKSHFAVFAFIVSFIGIAAPAITSADVLSGSLNAKVVYLSAGPSTASTPRAPNTSDVSGTAQATVVANGTAVNTAPTYVNVTAANPPVILANDYPVRLIIPSIGLNDPIQGVGVTSGGAMAVPSGNTNNVGWFKYGTMPGTVGSAVFDAHVFAAFKNLKNVPSGADIYVTMASGKTLHFVVGSEVNYPLASLSPMTLFGQTDAARLNLITCSGNLTADGSTYDHRLVLFAKLVA